MNIQYSSLSSIKEIDNEIAKLELNRSNTISERKHPGLLRIKDEQWRRHKDNEIQILDNKIETLNKYKKKYEYYDFILPTKLTENIKYNTLDKIWKKWKYIFDKPFNQQVEYYLHKNMALNNCNETLYNKTITMLEYCINNRIKKIKIILTNKKIYNCYKQLVHHSLSNNDITITDSYLQPKYLKYLNIVNIHYIIINYICNYHS